jgi:hypothetical protein
VPRKKLLGWKSWLMILRMTSRLKDNTTLIGHDMFVVREVEWGGDVDGTGPERWLGRVMGCFDTEAEALDFVDTQWTDCEVVEE